jgi:hypothetical protein
MYRVLRPCGGILTAPGLSREATAALFKHSGATPEEIRLDGPEPAVVRSPLPGTNDFDHRVADPRVRWPLQPLWFGGPGPALLADHRSGEHFAGPPVAARGRYFVQGETTLTAVDAYNGTVLWTRPVPKLWTDTRFVAGRMWMIENVGPPARPVDKHWRVRLGRRVGATAEHVFLHLGDDYSRGRGPGVVQLDARTGRQIAMYGPHVAGPELSLERPQTWTFRFLETATTEAGAGKVGDPPGRETVEGLTRAYHAAMQTESEEDAAATLPAESGLLTLSVKDAALRVRMVTREKTLTERDGWDLFFDFRPVAERYGLYGPATFVVRVSPSPGNGCPPRWEPISGSPPEALRIEGQTTDAGTETHFLLPLETLERWCGERPTGFGFAATYSSDVGAEAPEEPLRQRHLFGDARAQGLNAGWANVFLGAPSEPRPEGRRMAGHAVLAGPYVDAPKAWHAPGALAARDIDPSVKAAPRVHPLTGEEGPRVYRSGTWSCGGPSYSATCVFRRASKPGLGIYDFADDSGLRFFGGVSAPCGSSSIAALGLLLFSDSRFRCDCNPPIKTSLTLAPAERAYDEDWAVFHDRPVDTRIRHAAINFGAFGDQRDGRGDLWLAFPRDFDRAYGYPLRPATRGGLQTFSGLYLRHIPAGLMLPVQIDYDPAQGPYRMNSDRVAVQGTDRPWLYASGIEGIRRVAIRLDFLEPLASTEAQSPIEPDGVLNEPAWQGPPAVHLPHTGTEILLRHDSERLYVGARRAAMVARKGQPIPWARSAEGRDAEVWKDDSLELFLTDARQQTVLHVGVSASGAVFDARAGRGADEEDKAWNAPWQTGVLVNRDELAFEIALARAALREAGLDDTALRLNAMINQSDTRGDAAKYPGGEGRNWQLPNPTGEALSYLGPRGRQRVMNFAPLGLGRKPPYPTRRFTLRLHFAECRETVEADRVFGVRIQGRTVLERLDVVREAGGPRRAVVKEFRDISASDRIVVEFIAAEDAPTSDLRPGPFLSALELGQMAGG